MMPRTDQELPVNAEKKLQISINLRSESALPLSIQNITDEGPVNG
jgi:hypothetical protein